jgi:hypothetical protein
MSKKTLVCLAAALALTAGAAWAQPPADDLEWVPIAPGVWEADSNGTDHLYAEGADGMAFAVTRLQEHVDRLNRRQLENPQPELARTIERRTALIERILDRLSKGQFEARTKAAAPACFRTFSYGANAGIALGCGNFANANASYSTSCPESCSVDSYASVGYTCGDRSESFSKGCYLVGTNVSCQSAISQPVGGQPCDAYGSAMIFCAELNNLQLIENDNLSGCAGGPWCGC